MKVKTPGIVSPSDSLRFVSAPNIYGNWTIKFVPVIYSNTSVSTLRAYLGAPDPIAHAFKGVSIIRILGIIGFMCGNLFHL